MELTLESILASRGMPRRQDSPKSADSKPRRRDRHRLQVANFHSCGRAGLRVPLFDNKFADAFDVTSAC